MANTFHRMIHDEKGELEALSAIDWTQIYGSDLPGKIAERAHRILAEEAGFDHRSQADSGRAWDLAKSEVE